MFESLKQRWQDASERVDEESRAKELASQRRRVIPTVCRT